MLQPEYEAPSAAQSSFDRPAAALGGGMSAGGGAGAAADGGFIPDGASAEGAAPLMSQWAEGAGGGMGGAGGGGGAGEGAGPGGAGWDFDSPWAGHGGGDGGGGPAQAAAGVMPAMEGRFGQDFSGVTFSTGLPAEAQRNGAKAYAEGDHVAMDPGLDMRSPGGQRILAHELAHVVQKRRGVEEPDAVDQHVEDEAPGPALAAHAAESEHLAADKGRRDQLEREADNASEQVAQGGRPEIGGGARAPRKQFFGLGDIWDKAKSTASGALDKAKEGASWVGDKAKAGASWAGDKVKAGASWVGDKAKAGASWAGDKIKAGASWAGDKIKAGASWVADKAKAGGSWAWDKIKSGASWVGDKVKQGFNALKKKASDTWSDLKKAAGQEGLLKVLIDPKGAMDRQKAQRELSDRFQVMPDDFVGPRLPNQVSKKEFEQIAKNYSDIRLGRTDIQFNTEGLNDKDATEYKNKTMGDLASIMQTEHGRKLLNDLAHNPKDHKTTLSPLFKKDAAGNYDASLGRDNTNGFASASDSSKAYQSADGKTQGAGTDSRVRYNAGETISPDGATDKWLPWRSDVLLYHELVHSRDHTMGTLAPGKDAATGENLREQRATGLGIYKDEEISENAYRRDRKLLGNAGVGARPGDKDMPHRDSYFYHTAPAAPPGGTPGGTASPGTAHDPHGDHDHGDEE